MAETQTKTPPKEEEANVPKFRKAVDWAVEQSMKDHGNACGVCQWRPWDHGSEAQTKQALSQHIRRKHRETIVDLYDHQVLSLSDLKPHPPGESEDELLQAAGITDIQDLDRMDLLAIPASIRKRMEVDGSVPRWVRRERVDHFLQQGARLIKIGNGEEGTRQPSTEDGVLRTGEMYAVELPHELAQKRRAQKSRRIVDQLNARAEEIQAKRDEYEQKAYDYLRRERNLDHTQAQQVSRALTQRRVREGDRSNLGLTISDRHGEVRH